MSTTAAKCRTNRKRKAHKQLLKIIINSFFLLLQLLLSGAKYFNFSVCIIIMSAPRLFESTFAGIKCAPCLFINFTFTNLHIFRHAIFATYFFHLQHAHASLPLFNFNAMLLNFIHWKKRESWIKARIGRMKRWDYFRTEAAYDSYYIKRISPRI